MEEKRLQNMAEPAKRRRAVKKRTKPYEIRLSDITSYLNKVKKSGRTETTIGKYRYDLNRFYEFLDDSKQIMPDTLIHWKQHMIDAGYAPRTINSSMVAVNGFLKSIGCHEWQLFDWMELDGTEMIELTREEYQLLLQEAKLQENIQLYLITKTLVCMDLTPSDLPLLTREAINRGVVLGKMRGVFREVVIPKVLCEELLDFAMKRGIRSGSVFLNRNRKPYSRIMIGKMIASLGETAGLEPGKALPRNMRRLYLNTLEDFQKRADEWVSESYARLLEEEESQVGWKIWLPEMQEAK